MSYYEPNTTIYLFSGVPLESTYEHTIFWETSTARENYFSANNATFVLTAQNYQRVKRGWLRISLPIPVGSSSSNTADRLRVCNYMAFQNTNHHSKWFYAFIKNVEYINNNVAEIEYEIDVMTTWQFSYSLGHCFVDREHSANDNLYGNLVTENLDVGDYVIQNYKYEDMTADRLMVLFSKYRNEPSTPSPALASVVNHIFTTLHRAVWDVEQMETSQSYLNNVVATINNNIGTENIVGVYQFPHKLLPTETPPIISVQDLRLPTNINGRYVISNHIVRNNKLMSYPYHYLIVNNHAGQTSEYRFEQFNFDNEAQFKIHGVCVTIPSCLCYPLAYKNMDYPFQEGVEMSNFPDCAITGDAFTEWWAQHKNSFITSNITSAISTSASTALITAAVPEVAVATAGVHTAINIANSMAKIQDIKALPPQIHGTSQCDSLNAGLGLFRFSFYGVSIRKEYAEMIDDYFDRYGYATKRSKVPNRNVRPHWTYTKTLDCVIKERSTAGDNVPNDDLKKISEIYNNGITFWKNPSEVGDYSLDNRPT